jgi:hypothetical protein
MAASSRDAAAALIGMRGVTSRRDTARPTANQASFTICCSWLPMPYSSPAAVPGAAIDRTATPLMRELRMPAPMHLRRLRRDGQAVRAWPERRGGGRVDAFLPHLTGRARAMSSLTRSQACSDDRTYVRIRNSNKRAQGPRSRDGLTHALIVTVHAHHLRARARVRMNRRINRDDPRRSNAEQMGEVAQTHAWFATTHVCRVPPDARVVMNARVHSCDARSRESSPRVRRG